MQNFVIIAVQALSCGDGDVVSVLLFGLIGAIIKDTTIQSDPKIVYIFC